MFAVVEDDAAGGAVVDVDACDWALGADGDAKVSGEVFQEARELVHAAFDVPAALGYFDEGDEVEGGWGAKG